MKKVSKDIVMLTVFIILVIFAGLFTKTPVNTPIQDYKIVSGLDIQFRDGIAEPEVKTVLEKYNLPTYKLDYNVDRLENSKYYIMADKDKMTDIKGELRNLINWSEVSYTKKGNYYVITVPEQVVQDKNFLEVANKYALQLNKFVWCHVHFGDNSKNSISEERAKRIKQILEKDENVFFVSYTNYIPA